MKWSKKERKSTFIENRKLAEEERMKEEAIKRAEEETERARIEAEEEEKRKIEEAERRKIEAEEEEKKRIEREE